MEKDNKVPKIVFDKVLYVTDLSESGRYAFPYAASIANCHGASLTVFHAVEDFAFERYLVGYIGDDLWNELSNEIRTFLDGISLAEMMANEKVQNVSIRQDGARSNAA